MEISRKSEGNLRGISPKSHGLSSKYNGNLMEITRQYIENLTEIPWVLLTLEPFGLDVDVYSEI